MCKQTKKRETIQEKSGNLFGRGLREEREGKMINNDFKISLKNYKKAC